MLLGIALDTKREGTSMIPSLSCSKAKAIWFGSFLEHNRYLSASG